MSVRGAGAIGPDVYGIFINSPGLAAFIAFVCSCNLPELMNMGMGTGVILTGIAVDLFILLFHGFRTGAAEMLAAGRCKAGAYEEQTKNDHKKYTGDPFHRGILPLVKNRRITTGWIHSLWLYGMYLSLSDQLW